MSTIRCLFALLNRKKITKRFFGTYTGSQPFSKKQIRQKRPRELGSYSYNDPSLDGKYLRYAERIARETGVLDALQEFDAAAAKAGFPNPPRIFAATVLERSNVILRDLETWESSFLTFADDKRKKEAKQYPQALLDIWTANERVVGGGTRETKDVSSSSTTGDNVTPTATSADKVSTGKGKGVTLSSSAPGKPTNVVNEKNPNANAATKKATPDVTLQAGKVSLGSFYDQGGSSSSNSMGVNADAMSGLQVTSRTTAADQIGDLRSLDRAYSQRLVLVVRDRATGEWILPAGERLEGEPMQQAAERSMKEYFAQGAQASSAPPNLWYVGQTPVGHWLRVYSPDMQAKTKCYGEKIFFYRAEILSGRFRLPKEPMSSTLPFDDFYWLTRDETEKVFPRPFYKYAHQMIGGGAGEEIARSEAWRNGLKSEKMGNTLGVPIKNAVARRFKRVNRAKANGVRLKVIATSADAELAASPRTTPRRNELLASAIDKYHDRIRETRSISLSLRASLNRRPAVELLRAKLLESTVKGSSKVSLNK
jgi:hypothetical protein